jgi:hypothetical protein
MNEIEKRKSTEATAVAAANPFLAYGEAQNQRGMIVGKLLKFSKGDYLAGQDNEEVPMGTELIANMDEMLAGWVKWQDNKPVEQIMGKVSEGYQPPRRKDLSDTDTEQWEIDVKGEPRDPWQFSNLLILKSDKGLFTFTTSSKGGLNALGDLCKVYGQAMAQRPDEYPVIALGSGSYDHPNKTLGRIKIPTFKVVGWALKKTFADTEEAVIPLEQPSKKGKARF